MSLETGTIEDKPDVKSETATAPGDGESRARAEAQAAEARLREAIDILPQGIVFLDAEGRYIMAALTSARRDVA